MRVYVFFPIIPGTYGICKCVKFEEDHEHAAS
jgi:hypothetical protein